MNRYSRVLLAGLFILGLTPVRAQNPARGIESIVRSLERRLIEARRHLHMYPELSNREFETSKYIAARLRDLGLDEVRTGIAKTGVVGILRGTAAGPVVAVRADMDALPVTETLDVPYRSRNPGVKHACGHDVHMTVALGTAEVLQRLRRQGSEIPGTVVFIFQPAEEGAPPGEEGGARLMVEQGVLRDPPVQAIFGLHANPTLAVGTLGYTRGPILASSDRFEIVVRGKQTHGAYPHQGQDPILIAAHLVLYLQSIVSRRLDPRDPAVVSVGIFESGQRFNIIPMTARLEGTVRTLNPETRKKIPQWMEEIARGVVEAYGAEYTFHYQEGPPVTVNDARLVDAMLPVLRDALGAEHVIEVQPQMGAEDFAYYAQEIPAMYFWLGVRNPQDPTLRMLHTPEFDVDERSIAVGVRVMTRLVLSYLQQNR